MYNACFVTNLLYGRSRKCHNTIAKHEYRDEVSLIYGQIDPYGNWKIVVKVLAHLSIRAYKVGL